MGDVSGAVKPRRQSRRRFLRQSAALALSTLALRHGVDAHAETTPLEAVSLPGNLLAVLGPNANCVAAEGDDGVVLVDGGSADWSDRLLAQIEDTFSSKPIRALVNTHWHPEQTGSNLVLGSRGVDIIAHENTKLWLGDEISVGWSGEKYAPLPPAALPKSTFVESTILELAGRTLDCRYLLNAHTDGDVCVFFPDSNVLVTGGAVSNAGWPVIDWWTGGWLGGLLDGYQKLLGIADTDTRIVPSVGPIMSLAELRSQNAMYLTIFERLESMLRKSYATDEVLAALPTAEFDAEWGDSRQFVTSAFHSMWGHLRDAYDRRLRNIP